jgi:stage V sporulation protein SpoVS
MSESGIQKPLNRVWIVIPAALLVVIGCFALINGKHSTTASNTELASQYSTVMQDATKVQHAVQTMSEDEYFKATKALKQSYRDLESMVPTVQLDTRSIKSLAYGETELWWTWNWHTWKWTDPSTTKETFLQRTTKFFEKEQQAVESEVAKDVNTGEKDAQETAAALQSAAAYAKTHTASQDETAAAAFVSRHLDWAKNKLCVMGAATVFDGIVNGATSAEVAAMCAGTICPNLAEEVDAIGAGAVDAVADAVSTAVGAGCVAGCAYAVDEAEDMVANEGLKLSTSKGVTALSEQLCQKIHCGPISSAAKN